MITNTPNIKMKSYHIILGLLSIIIASSCTLSYNANDVINSTNSNLSKVINLKSANLITKSLKSVKFDEKEQRLIFEFEAKVENVIKNFECNTFKLSANPVFKDGKVYIIDGRAEDISRIMPLTGAIDLIRNIFFSNLDIETVQLEWIKKSLSKSLYIKGKEIKVKWCIF